MLRWLCVEPRKCLIARMLELGNVMGSDRKNRIAHGMMACGLLLSSCWVQHAYAVDERVVEAARYEHGEGVERDFAKAAELYCGAAKAGSADAQYALGWMYANGRGVERSDRVAAKLMELAAAQGHEQARKMLDYLRRDPEVKLPDCMLASEKEIAVEQSDSDPNHNPQVEYVRLIVAKLAPRYEVDPKLAMSVIAVESGFNFRAQSPKNARGLMQLIPETAERYRVKDVWNPEDNVKGGLAYLRFLLDTFHDDVQLVAAAYNAGEKAVINYRGVPPYPETQDYVKRVLSLYQHTTHRYRRNRIVPTV